MLKKIGSPKKVVLPLTPARPTLALSTALTASSLRDVLSKEKKPVEGRDRRLPKAFEDCTSSTSAALLPPLKGVRSGDSRKWLKKPYVSPEPRKAPTSSSCVALERRTTLTHSLSRERSVEVDSEGSSSASISTKGPRSCRCKQETPRPWTAVARRQHLKLFWKQKRLSQSQPDSEDSSDRSFNSSESLSSAAEHLENRLNPFKESTNDIVKYRKSKSLPRQSSASFERQPRKSFFYKTRFVSKRKSGEKERSCISFFFSY